MFAAMNVEKTYMGRIIYAPQHDAPGELWLNIGWNSKDNQMWPTYPPHLQGHVSQADYDALKREFDTVIQEADIDPSKTRLMCFGAMVCCQCCCCPCPLCALYYHMKSKTDKCDGKLQQIVAQHNGNWGGGLSMRRCDDTRPTARAPEAMATDSAGRPLETYFRQGKHGGYTAPSWPPLGYNIIVAAGKWSMPEVAAPTQAPGQVVMAQIIGQINESNSVTD